MPRFASRSTQASRLSRNSKSNSSERTSTGTESPRSVSRLVPLEVDLHERRLTVLRDQLVQRDDVDALDVAPPVLGEAAALAHGVGPLGGERRRRVRGGDEEVGGSRSGTDRCLDDFDVRPEPVAQELDAAVLQLDRDHASAEGAKYRGPCPHVGADVEAEVPRRDELSIERPGLPGDPGRRALRRANVAGAARRETRHPPCRP